MSVITELTGAMEIEPDFEREHGTSSFEKLFDNHMRTFKTQWSSDDDGNLYDHYGFSRGFIAGVSKAGSKWPSHLHFGGTFNHLPTEEVLKHIFKFVQKHKIDCNIILSGERGTGEYDLDGNIEVWKYDGIWDEFETDMGDKPCTGFKRVDKY